MELLNLAKPSNNRLTSFTVKSSSNNRTNPLHKNPSSPSTGLQFRKLSNKELSKILRTDAAIEAIERKANSSKYNNLQAKPVLEALGDAIRLNRWVSALKVFFFLLFFAYPFFLKYCFMLCRPVLLQLSSNVFLCILGLFEYLERLGLYCRV